MWSFSAPPSKRGRRSIFCRVKFIRAWTGCFCMILHYVRDAILRRLRQSYGANPGMLAALGTRGPVVASIGHAGTAPPYALGYGQDAPTALPPAIAPMDNQFAAWSQALGAWGDLDGNGNAATLQRSLGGLDHRFRCHTFDDLWRMGLAGGYTQSSLDVNARLSSGSVDAYHLALYGGGQLGALGLRTGAAYSWDNIKTTRDHNLCRRRLLRLRLRLQRPGRRPATWLAPRRCSARLVTP